MYGPDRTLISVEVTNTGNKPCRMTNYSTEACAAERHLTEACVYPSLVPQKRTRENKQGKCHGDHCVNYNFLSPRSVLRTVSKWSRGSLK